MEELLYKSEGAPAARQKKLNASGILVLGCGALFLFMYVACPWIDFALWAGIGCLAMGVIMLITNKNSSAHKARFLLYEQHMEGTDPNCKEFSCRYEDVVDVSKVIMLGNEMIQVKTAKTVYTVLVDDATTAYQILCDKVYGEG